MYSVSKHCLSKRLMVFIGFGMDPFVGHGSKQFAISIFVHDDKKNLISTEKPPPEQEWARCGESGGQLKCPHAIE